MSAAACLALEGASAADGPGSVRAAPDDAALAPAAGSKRRRALSHQDDSLRAPCGSGRPRNRLRAVAGRNPPSCVIAQLGSFRQLALERACRKGPPGCPAASAIARAIPVSCGDR